MLDNERRPDNLSDQTMNVPSIEESLSREDILRSFEELTATISPLELEAITEIVENLHQDAEMSGTASDVPLLALSLELKVGNGAGAHLIPVTLKNLSSGMVVLEADNFEGIRNPETLQGKQAILRVMSAENPEWMSINGIMTWTYNTTDQTININLRIQVAQPNKQTTKILENSLSAASGEMKRLWTLRDETQANRESVLTRLKAKLLPWRRLS